MKQNFPFLNDMDSLNMSVNRQKISPERINQDINSIGKVQTRETTDYILTVNNSFEQMPKHAGINRFRGKGDEILV